MLDLKADLNEIKESQKNTENAISDIRVAIAEIRVDVAHHIRRSDANESAVARIVWWVIATLTTLVGVLAAMLAAIKF